MENIIFNFVIVKENRFGSDDFYSQHRTLDEAKSRFKKDFAVTNGVLRNRIIHVDGACHGESRGKPYCITSACTVCK